VKLAVGAGIPENVALLATHMFLFYVSMLADITPPVGLSNFAAAAVFGLDPIRVGVKAALVAIPKYLYALSFIWSYWGTAILILPVIFTAPLATAIILVLSRFLAIIVGIIFLSVANVGFYSNCNISMPARIILAASGIALFIPSEVLNLTGFLIGAALLTLLPRSKSLCRI